MRTTVEQMVLARDRTRMRAERNGIPQKCIEEGLGEFALDWSTRKGEYAINAEALVHPYLCRVAHNKIVDSVRAEVAEKKAIANLAKGLHPTVGRRQKSLSQKSGLEPRGQDAQSDGGLEPSEVDDAASAGDDGDPKSLLATTELPMRSEAASDDEAEGRAGGQLAAKPVHGAEDHHAECIKQLFAQIDSGQAGLSARDVEFLHGVALGGRTSRRLGAAWLASLVYGLATYSWARQQANEGTGQLLRSMLNSVAGLDMKALVQGKAVESQEAGVARVLAQLAGAMNRPNAGESIVGKASPVERLQCASRTFLESSRRFKARLEERMMRLLTSPQQFREAQRNPEARDRLEHAVVETKRRIFRRVRELCVQHCSEGACGAVGADLKVAP